MYYVLNSVALDGFKNAINNENTVRSVEDQLSWEVGYYDDDLYIIEKFVKERLEDISSVFDTFDIAPYYKEKLDKQLRVFRILGESKNPLIEDFSILGFRKMSPSYDRGKKVRAEYKCIHNDELIVTKDFIDVRDENGILTGLQIHFKWYCEDNTVGLEKIETVKNYNKYEAETEERKRRYRQFDYLRASAKGTPNEPYIAMIINHYANEIKKYQDDGLLDLDVAIQNESDPTISAILSAPVPRNDGQGNTNVGKAIRYQLGTIGLSEL